MISIINNKNIIAETLRHLLLFFVCSPIQDFLFDVILITYGRYVILLEITLHIFWACATKWPPSSFKFRSRVMFIIFKLYKYISNKKIELVLQLCAATMPCRHVNWFQCPWLHLSEWEVYVCLVCLWDQKALSCVHIYTHKCLLVIIWITSLFHGYVIIFSLLPWLIFLEVLRTMCFLFFNIQPFFSLFQKFITFISL